MPNPPSTTSISLPPAAAGPVLTWVLRGLRTDRVNGVSIPPWAGPLCQQLAAAAGHPTAPSAARGTPVDTLDAMTHYVPTRAAAATTGVSTGYVRRLARTGRILARRAGRDWLVDPASLTAVLERAHR